MTLTSLTLTPLLARSRGEFYEKLMNGDPLSWSVLGGVVVVSLGWYLWKKKKSE